MTHETIWSAMDIARRQRDDPRRPTGPDMHRPQATELSRQSSTTGIQRITGMRQHRHNGDQPRHVHRDHDGIVVAADLHRAARQQPSRIDLRIDHFGKTLNTAMPRKRQARAAAHAD
jgi:hypothetical protein